MTAYPYGFLVRGAADEPRRVVDARRAFAAFCGCDPNAKVEEQSFLSAFWFGRDFRDYFESNCGTEKGFSGFCWQPFVLWDNDCHELDQALTDARRLATCS